MGSESHPSKVFIVWTPHLPRFIKGEGALKFLLEMGGGGGGETRNGEEVVL